MQNITIGRYSPLDPGHPRIIDGKTVEDVADYFAGWIEGVRDDGSSWIMYLDASGNPESYWARREEDGAVIGDPIAL